MPLLQNRTFDEIAVGDSAELKRTLTEDDIRLFAVMSGDVNPAHLDPEYADHTRFHGVIAHGMWSGALISTLLGTELPGPGTIYIGQNLEFHRPVRPGDTIAVHIAATEKMPERKRVRFDCRCLNQRGELVTSGVAEVIAPTEKIRREAPELPDISFRAHNGYERLLHAAQGMPAVRSAIVHPCSEEALRAALEARDAGLIEPVLVGPRERILRLAAETGLPLDGAEIVDTEHSHASAECAVALARAGSVAALIKGSLHTDELMHAVVDKNLGLRTPRRISHAFLIDVPNYPKPVLITDAAINICPKLMDKRDIVQNAIDLALSVGIREPRVALLSAVETVNPDIASTLDAAALCKMADRGQITGGLLDGPLAFDNAINLEAARIKGIVSPVAGQADILVVPDLEAGNMLYKHLTFLAGADAAGIVLGARVPIVLTSRADPLRNRLASTALATILIQTRAVRLRPA